MKQTRFERWFEGRPPKPKSRPCIYCAVLGGQVKGKHRELCLRARGNGGIKAIRAAKKAGNL